MKKLGKKGFTLIELIAVLVILAILVLIVTPLVMNIVKKAKDASNRRSVDAYGKSMELAVVTYLLDYGQYPSSLDNLTVEYSGNEVTCNTKILSDDGSIYLSGCSVKNTEVLDNNNEDGYYHYGKTTAVVNNKFSLRIGDIVTYKGIDFYVIEDSDEDSETVRLLKAEPLKEDDVKDCSIPSDTWTGGSYTIDENQYANVMYGSLEYVDSNPYKYNMCWAEKVLNKDDLEEEIDILNINQLVELGLEINQSVCYMSFNSNSMPKWLYGLQYNYWLSDVSQSNDIGYISSDGHIYYDGPYFTGYNSYSHQIRPVITLKKNAIEDYVSQYNTGEKISYQNVDYLVVKNTNEYVSVIPETPLTTEDIRSYGVINGINYINRNTNESQGSVIDSNGYGKIAYYSNQTCGYVNDSLNISGCTNSYDNSDVKKVIDNYVSNVFNSNDLYEDNDGYVSRILKGEEYLNLGYDIYQTVSSSTYTAGNSALSVLSNYSNWTMTINNDSSNQVLAGSDEIRDTDIYEINYVLPVINLKKSAIK